jgi:membrane fusion protein, macrolide-specific efflux system
MQKPEGSTRKLIPAVHFNRTGAVTAAVILIIAGGLLTRACILGRARTARPKVGPVVEAVYALGTVKSERNYNLRLGVSSSITAMYVTEGQTVKKGSPLLVTDSGVTFDAPFGGIVYKLNFEKGENVMPGIPVLTIIDPSATYILVSLDQQSAVKVKKLQAVELSFEGMRSEKSTGIVDRIYPSNSQFFARIYTSDMPRGVLPDMNVDCAITVARKDKALLIPVGAVRDGMVTLKRGVSTKKVPCKTGIVNEGWAEVLDGSVRPGDEIIMAE